MDSSNKKPIQINLRIFVNQQNIPQPIPIQSIHNPNPNPAPIVQQIPHPNYQLHPPVTYQRGPVYMPVSSVGGYEGRRGFASSPAHYQQVHTTKQFDRILPNQVYKVGSVQVNKFHTNQRYQPSLPKTHQKTHHKLQHQPQKQSYKPEIIPQTPIKCPICQQLVYRSNQAEHQQYHRNRISNFIYIPKYEAKQNNIPVYSRDDLLRILIQYEQRIKEKVIQEINTCKVSENKHENYENYEKNVENIVSASPQVDHKDTTEQKVTKVANNKPQEDVFCIGTQDRIIQKDVLPLSHTGNKQMFPSKQLTSPNISNIRLEDQSECFSQLDQLEAPQNQITPSQVSKLELPLSSAQKQPTSQLIQNIAKNNPNILEYQPQPQNNQSSYYKSLISEIRTGQQFSKRKKLPSNIMAYDAIKRT